MSKKSIQLEAGLMANNSFQAYRRITDSTSLSQKANHASTQQRMNINTQKKKSKKQLNSDKESEKSKKKQKFQWPIYKKLLKYAKRSWKTLLGSLIMTIISGVLLSMIPWEIGKVLDILTDADQKPDVQSNFQFYCFILAITIIALGIFAFARLILTQQVQEMIAVDMRSDIFGTFIHNDLRFYQQYKSGDLISRLGNDITQAKSAISNNLTFLLRNIINIVISMIVLLIMNWKLTCMILLTVPFFALIAYYYSKKNKVYTRQYQDVLAEMSAQASQKFKGISIVKAYCTEDEETNKYKQINIKGLKILTKRNLWFAIFYAMNQFLPYFAILIVLWYGGNLIISIEDQGLTAGQLTAFILYCNNLVSNTSAISQSYSSIISGTHAVQKVFQMLQYVPEVDEKVGLALSINGEVAFKNVDFKYPNSQINVIKDLSLKINKGQYVAFVGPSGSGKSTIVKLVQRLYKISSGYLYFGEHNAEDINVNILRKQIGLVSQEPILFSGTVKQNITYGLDKFTDEDVQTAAEKAGCLQFLNNRTLFPERFDTELGQNGTNISGGQKQRIAIARALIRKPKILIFDEATSALDSHSEAIIQKSIQNIAKNQAGMTIIVIAHRLSTIINANRIIMLKYGQVIEEGTHEYLKSKKGQYYQLVLKQLQEKQQ